MDELLENESWAELNEMAVEASGHRDELYWDSPEVVPSPEES